jgi:hypothetical protein
VPGATAGAVTAGIVVDTGLDGIAADPEPAWLEGDPVPDDGETGVDGGTTGGATTPVLALSSVPLSSVVPVQDPV